MLHVVGTFFVGMGPVGLYDHCQRGWGFPVRAEARSGKRREVLLLLQPRPWLRDGAGSVPTPLGHFARCVFFFSVILSIATMAESRPALGKGTTKHLARTDAEMNLTIFALVCTARRSVNASFNCVLLR